MPKRKIIVSLAVSADGFISRSDGSVDWLDRPRTAGDYGMGAFFKSIDTILMGRKTYEKALSFGGGGGFGKKIKSYVFSKRAGQSSDKVEFVNESITDFATRVRNEPGKNIWMMGGGGIIRSFLDANELDEFIIHVIPTFIGEGIPLIAPEKRTTALTLESSHAYSDGVVMLHYKVDKRSDPH